MVLFLFLVALVTLFFYNFYWKRRNLPPGPAPLPLIGNALSLGFEKPPYDVLLKWKDQYGPVYTYWFGELPVVAVNDFNIIKETFIKDGDAYAGRNFFTNFQQIMRDGQLLGVIITEGDLWRDQRRFTLHVLRNFGMGRTIIEDMIMVEVNRFMKTVQQDIENGVKEHNLIKIVNVCVGSIINKMLFGYRFEGETEHEFYHLREILDNLQSHFANPLSFVMMLLENPSSVKNVPGFKQLYNGMLEDFQELKEFLDRQIAWHRKNFAVDGNPESATNFVQAFMMEMHRREQTGNVGDFTLDQLRNMCFDLWVAGQETTSSTTSFGILYLTTHPEAQKKLQDELDRLVGNERQVSLNDRPKLPFTNAVCNETQRLCNLIPQNLFHRTTKDVDINGYKIKKGTTIVPQISCVLYDDKIFPNPDRFIPERFLDSNGQLKRVEELIPFSVGKRQCLGESMAKNELFLFLANLFHEFEVTPSNKNQTLEKENGFGVRPVLFKCCLKRRIPVII